MASGIAAGETVIQARAKGDFSQAALQHYENLLKEKFVLKDLDTFREAPEFLENERIYQTYPQMACEMARKIFQNDGKPRPKTYQLLKEGMQGKLSLWELLSDAWKARKAI
jgi:electron transfer flavoprotein-quinone oxidoreductase